jgi:hypothetical protein
MPIDSLDALALSLPVVAMSLVAGYLVCYRVKHLLWKPKGQRRRRRFGLIAPSAALGFAFLALPLMYRPSLELLVKAQIRQQEDVDEDDNGAPDSPAKHLLRQLRRIRRGEEVKRLVLRLE